MGRFTPFKEKYGLDGSVIAAASLISGIGSAVGLERVSVEGINWIAWTLISRERFAAAVSELSHRDFVLVNIKGADESGHDGLPLAEKGICGKNRCSARTAHLY